MQYPRAIEATVKTEVIMIFCSNRTGISIAG